MLCEILTGVAHADAGAGAGLALDARDHAAAAAGAEPAREARGVVVADVRPGGGEQRALAIAMIARPQSQPQPAAGRRKEEREAIGGQHGIVVGHASKMGLCLRK